MRRDHVTLDTCHTDAGDDRVPTVRVTVDEPTDRLDERLLTADGERLDADGIDAAFRFRTPVDAEDAEGVFSLSNRVTGEFVLEANADAGALLQLVDVACTDDANGGGHYRVVVRRDGDQFVAYEKRTLLVYDQEGSLLRGHSLIPSGVEL